MNAHIVQELASGFADLSLCVPCMCHAGVTVVGCVAARRDVGLLTCTVVKPSVAAALETVLLPRHRWGARGVVACDLTLYGFGLWGCGGAPASGP